MKNISRRDFLQLAGALAGAATANRLLTASSGKPPSRRSAANIIILVFDTLSAAHMSLYGYPRRTTPHFEEFAQRALVYHRHYANGNFTTPGAASLLTGMYPWTHRAINAAGLASRELSGRNLFSLMGTAYCRLAYTQNYWADFLLNQFSGAIDVHVPLSMYGAIDDKFVDQRLRKDSLAAYRAYESIFFQGSFQNPNSLVFGFFLNLYYQSRVRAVTPADYPLGLPTSNHLHHVYTLESTFDGVLTEISRLESLDAPYLAYIHLWPPHSPYRPRKEFVGRFAGDGYTPPVKPKHTLSTDSSEEKLVEFRREYDDYLANVDQEFGRLMQALASQGVLDRAHLLVTSDHGEMFERGTFGHFTPLLYEPVIWVPLLVSVPGRPRRQDFTGTTSNVDILPTALNIAGIPPPDWCEGLALPGLGGDPDAARTVISMDAKRNSANRPLTNATYTLIRGDLKVIHYAGYDGRYLNHFEFYDLYNDPAELNDLADKPNHARAFSEMRAELLAGIATANRRYE